MERVQKAAKSGDAKMKERFAALEEILKNFDQGEPARNLKIARKYLVNCSF